MLGFGITALENASLRLAYLSRHIVVDAGNGAKRSVATVDIYLLVG